jgi:hypothetical protein
MAIELTTANSQTLSGIRTALQTTDITQLFPECGLQITIGSQGYTVVLGSIGRVADFSAPVWSKLNRININAQTGTGVMLQNTLTAIRGAGNLTGLVANNGTTASFNVQSHALSAAALNQFFTDLPNPAPASPLTIVVTGNPGAATCNTSIATAKGYTVTT